MIDTGSLVAVARALATSHGLTDDDVTRIVDAMLDADEDTRDDVATVVAGIEAARAIAAE